MLAITAPMVREITQVEQGLPATAVPTLKDITQSMTNVMKIKSEKIEWGIDVVGIIMPDKGVNVLAEVGGKVKNIYFNIHN